MVLDVVSQRRVAARMLRGPARAVSDTRSYWEQVRQPHGRWKLDGRPRTALFVVVDLGSGRGLWVEGRMSQAADFFVSYTSPDRAWAEWIAWQLEAEGYQVVVQAWDFTPGRDWAHGRPSLPRSEW